ncbi:hypothetical protein BX616_008905 [Lobosporangium transversale]|nr:hypothetical protein BX616_008905 [Lobosporangium transversale]
MTPSTAATKPQGAITGDIHNKDNNTFNTLIASSIAAFTSRLCTHPLDTLKTRVQASNSPLPLLPTFVNLVKNKELYRGLPIALTLSVPALSVYLTAYDLSKDRLSKHFSYFGSNTVINHMASAVVAEISSGLFWTPMEVLKSKQQVENMSSHSLSSLSSIPSAATSASLPKSPQSRSSTGALPSSKTKACHIPTASFSTTRTTATGLRTAVRTFDLAKMIYRQEGLRGFYRGPYSIIYFTTYEHLKKMAWREQQRSATIIAEGHEKDTLPFMTIVTCAAVAAGIAGAISNIVDIVKTRWQISVLATAEDNSSTKNIIRQMFRQGGLASFTRGMGARVLWMVPSVTISMSTFEWLKAQGFAA